MYKAVNVNKGTYEEISKLAVQLGKPKSQVVEVLVNEYKKTKKDDEQKKLDAFNKEMKAKIKTLRLSRNLKISTDNLDDDFRFLADSDYGREQ